jgi:hypothetical protein
LIAARRNACITMFAPRMISMETTKLGIVANLPFFDYFHAKLHTARYCYKSTIL